MTSFKTAILFVEEAGFNLHDTMIYKRTCAFPDVVRYYQDFEYMFVFTKGKPKTVNLLRQPKTEGTLKNIFPNLEEWSREALTKKLIQVFEGI